MAMLQNPRYPWKNRGDGYEVGNGNDGEEKPRLVDGEGKGERCVGDQDLEREFLPHGAEEM